VNGQRRQRKTTGPEGGGDDVPAPNKTIEQINHELVVLKETVEKMDLLTFGDRRDVEAYKKSLQGKLEEVQKQMDDLAEDVGGFKSTLNKGITGFLMAVLGAAGLWVFNALTGGP
jgi:hypothetical protein